MSPVLVSISVQVEAQDEDEGHDTNKRSRTVETRETCSKKPTYKNAVQRASELRVALPVFSQLSSSCTSKSVSSGKQLALHFPQKTNLVSDQKDTSLSSLK